MASILVCLFRLLLASHLFCIISLSNGFSLELIHRDSPHSPLYHDSNLSHLKALWRDIKTSKTRVSTILHSDILLQYSLIFREPLFTLDVSIGSPATKTTLVFDTTAPLTWTQCQPCIKCFKQDYPVFDPTKSATFKRMRRNHNLAAWFNCTVLECYYFVDTRVGQSSSGIVSMETFFFRGPPGFVERPLTDVVFGCGTYNNGPLGPTTVLTGILGMGNFPTSLVRQFGDRAVHRFSYCLSGLRLPGKKSSVLSFGEEAVISGENVQTTPFMRGPQGGKLLQGSYRLNLIGISVAGKRLEISESSFNGECIIDTGSPLSVIEEQAYQVVLNAFSSYFGQFKNIKKIVNKKYPKNICYKYPRGFRKFPGMIWHFEGANLEVNGTSLFMFGRTFLLSNFMCLQLLGKQKTNVLGVYQQQNVRFLYDLGNEKLSFVKESC